MDRAWQERERTKKYVEESIRTIPNFPKDGVMFRDITTAWKDKDAYSDSQDLMMDLLPKESAYDVVAAVEARGWVYGAVIAYERMKAFVPIRKHGKLPGETMSAEYDLEYGSNILEIHRDAISPEDRVVLVDDLIATGGSTLAAVELIENLGGKIVKIISLADLQGLKGLDRIRDAGYDVDSVISYPGI